MLTITKRIDELGLASYSLDGRIIDHDNQPVDVAEFSFKADSIEASAAYYVTHFDNVAIKRAIVHDAPINTKPLYLIACSNAKLAHSAPAGQLYTGQAFKLATAAAERAGADVIILSALHGAVNPTRELQPYNRALAAMNRQQRKVWAGMTAQQLQQHKGRPVTVLAGKHYAAAVEGWPNVSLPLAGLGIGQQLAALKSLNT